MMTDLRAGVWTELSQNRVRVDVYRRNLQRAHIESLASLLSPPEPPRNAPVFGPQRPRYPSDTRAAARGELVTLRRQANAALGRAADEMTRLHLRDVVMEIDRILDVND